MFRFMMSYVENWRYLISFRNLTKHDEIKVFEIEVISADRHFGVKYFGVEHFDANILT